MTCPCPRPAGLTDTAVRIALDAYAPGLLVVSGHYCGCVRPERQYGRRGMPGPDCVPCRGTGWQDPWHVVEWRRCGSESDGDRCHEVMGHGGSHSSNAAGDNLWDNLGMVGPGVGEPTWAVPCWVTTQAEAETWRPAPVVTGVDLARGPDVTTAAVYGRDGRITEVRAWVGEQEVPATLGPDGSTVATLPVSETDPFAWQMEFFDLTQSGVAVAAWVQGLARWVPPPRPRWWQAEPLFDRALGWWRARAARRARLHTDAVTRALLRGQLGVGRVGLPVDLDTD